MLRTRLLLLSGFVFVLIAMPAFMLKSGATNLTNSPPVAVNDSYTIHTSLLISPMQNDYDPDPGDGISFQGITTQPQHGSLTIYNTGTYTYRPTYGYVGSDSFTYTICDSHSAWSTGTVNITAVNQAPIANTDNYTVHTSIIFSLTEMTLTRMVIASVFKASVSHSTVPYRRTVQAPIPIDRPTAT